MYFAGSILVFCSFFIGKPCFTDGVQYHLDFFDKVVRSSELLESPIVQNIKQLVRRNHLEVYCAEKKENDGENWKFLSSVDELGPDDLEDPSAIHEKNCEFVFRRSARKTLKEIVQIVWGFTKLKMFKPNTNSKWHRVAIEVHRSCPKNSPGNSSSCQRCKLQSNGGKGRPGFGDFHQGEFKH